MAKKRIAIIGGGYTGLAAAYDLAMAGYEVVIYERGDTLGGLASGFEINGTNLERTYHHLFRTDKDIIKFAEELGIGDKLVWNDSSMAIYYGGKLYAFGSAVDLLKFQPLNFFNRIRAGVVVLFLQKWKNWQSLRSVTALNWMRTWAGKQVSDVIWEPLLRGKFANYFDKVAMPWLWARIHIRANSRLPGEAKEKLGYFAGGFQVFSDALTSKLTELGVQFSLGAVVEAIHSGEVVLSPDGSGTSDRIVEKYDAVLATIPSSIFAKLVQSDVSPEYVTQLNSTNYLGAIVMVFTMPQSLSKFYWHNINEVGAPFLVFLQHTNLIAADNYQGEHVYYIGAYLPHDHRYWEMSEDQIASEWFEYLQKLFPQFDPAQITQKFTFKLKNAQHIVDLGFEQRIPDHQTPLPNVYLSNFAQIFPEDRGTNYAVREGRKVARLINDDLNLSAKV